MTKQQEWLDEVDKRTAKEGSEDPHDLFWTGDRDADPYYEEIDRLVRPEGKSVLDVGCGYGWFVRHMLEAGILPRKYVGIDRAEGAIKKCEQKYGAASEYAKMNFTFRQGSWPEFVDLKMSSECLVENDSFDLVAMIGLSPFAVGDEEEMVHKMVLPALSVGKIVAFEILWEGNYGGRLRSFYAGRVLEALETMRETAEVFVFSSRQREGVLFVVQSNVCGGGELVLGRR